MPNASNSLMNYLRGLVGAWRDDPRDDAELLALYADHHDENAFRALAWRHGEMVWRTCRRILGNVPDAEDVFQTVFLTLTRKASRLRREPLAGWLHRVTRQAALNVDATARRRRGLEQELQTTKSSESRADTARIEQEKVLDEELAGLPEKLRVPLVLHFLEEKTQSEVARILGCSQSAVQKRLTRGEAVLRKRLEQRGMALGVGSITMLLGNAAEAPTMPAGLIASTARAAFAFRAKTLTGASAEAAEKLLRSLSIKKAVGKSWWLVLATSVCSLGTLGAGLVVWKCLVSSSDDVGAPASPVATSAAVTAPPQIAVHSRGFDLYGDPLPKDAIARIGTVRFRAPGRDNQSKANGNVVECFNVALSPDGKILASSHHAYEQRDKHVAIRFWETATGKQLHEIFLGGDPNRTQIVFSLDGKMLAAATNENTVWLIDTATGRQVENPLSGCQPFSGTWPFALTSDSKTLATSDAGGAFAKASFTLYDIGTRTSIRTMAVEKINKRFNFTFAAFSRDGRSFACVEEPCGVADTEKACAVHLLDVKTCKERATLKGRQVVALVFSPDGGSLVTAGRDKVIRVWNAKNGREVRQLGSMTELPSMVDFLPDGKTVLAACAGQVLRWDMATGEAHPALDCKGLLWPRILSADGTKLIERVGSALTIWDATTSREIGPAVGAPRSRMELLTFSPDGKSLATIGGAESEIHLWETATGKPLGSLAVPTPIAYFGEIAWPSRNMLITLTSARPDTKSPNPLIIQLTKDAAGGSFVNTQLHSGGIKFSPDGQVQVRRHGSGLELLEVATGKILSTVPCPLIKDPWELVVVPTLIFSADHLLLATHSPHEPTVAIWEVSTGRKLYSFDLPEHTDDRLEVRKYDQLIGFSPDGRLVVTQDEKDKDVSLWEHVSGRLRLRLPLPPECIPAYNNVALSPDSRLLAMGCISSSKGEERSIHVWDLTTEKECHCFRGHKAGVGDAGAPRAVFSPDGRHLASAGMDYTVLVWDVRQPPELATLDQPLDPKQLQVLKMALLGADAAAAYRAMVKLRQIPEQAIALATECLQQKTPTPESIPVSQVVNRLIGDLDSDDFQTRMKAVQELRTRLNEEAVEFIVQSILNETLVKGKPSVEVKHAITRLLAEQKAERKWGGSLSPELTRMFRAIEVLESIHNDDAIEMLQRLVAAPPRPEVRREAEAALKRLAAYSPGRFPARP